jgi:DNA repair protein RadA/Sms
VAPSALGTPRRAVVGWENSRLAMVLAVLETHGGLKLGQHDVYLNVAGGLRVGEPAADLAVAAALVSSLTGAILPSGAVHFGEIALSGAIRPVSVAAARLREAAKLGFESAVLAAAGADIGDGNGLRLRRLSHVGELVADIAASAPRARSGQRASQADR